MLLGRDDACARVEDLLASVRHGRSEALVVLGPAGIGKTALLGYAFERAQGMQVLRARGDPAEVGIPYAGLSQLLSPLLDLLPSLSRPQAAAIAAALAIGPPAGKEAFPVYAATLSLLATAASQTPLLVLVDDGHWIDVASMDALLFAQRRLALDPVLLLLTFRLGQHCHSHQPGCQALSCVGSILSQQQHCSNSGGTASTMSSCRGWSERRVATRLRFVTCPPSSRQQTSPATPLGLHPRRWDRPSLRHTARPLPSCRPTHGRPY